MQLFRAETLEEHLKAGIEVGKIDKMRPWLERRCCMSLTRSDHLMEQYLGPLRKKHNAKLRGEVKGELVAVAHDGTTHEGEAFTTTLRWLNGDVEFKARANRVHFLESSLDNEEISGILITDICQNAQKPLTDVMSINNDSASPNISSYNNTTQVVMPYADSDPCMPHTGSNAGDHMNLPNLGEFMKEYTIAVGHSKVARNMYKKITKSKL